MKLNYIRSKMSISDEEEGEFSDEKTNEICHYLNENYKEKIRLSELCFLFGTNKTTLCKRFKAVCGETVVSYINKLKIKEAKRLLRKGSFNLTEISAIVGFSSLHYFSRVFKQYENQSPTHYIDTIKSRLML